MLLELYSKVDHPVTNFEGVNKMIISNMDSNIHTTHGFDFLFILLYL